MRIRYQELRHRAAELELNATTTSGNQQQHPDQHPSTSRERPSAASGMDSGSSSSSDRFWRTLMNAAENLRALSNIGRSLNQSGSGGLTGESARKLFLKFFIQKFVILNFKGGGEASGRSSDGGGGPPSLDQDARMRIQLLSRHIENMQRICRSHLEMTRHRRQVKKKEIFEKKSFSF